MEAQNDNGPEVVVISKGYIRFSRIANCYFFALAFFNLVAIVLGYWNLPVIIYFMNCLAMGMLCGMSIKDLKVLNRDTKSMGTTENIIWFNVYCLMCATAVIYVFQGFFRDTFSRPPTFFCVILFIVWLRIIFSCIMDLQWIRTLEKFSKDNILQEK